MTGQCTMVTAPISAKDFFRFSVDGKTYWFAPDTGLACQGARTAREVQAIIDRMDRAVLAQFLDRERKAAKRLELILLTTNECNLSCAYCYSEYERKKVSRMDWEIARKAIDYAFDARPNYKYFSTFFHGDGEPTLNFELMREATAHVQNKCSGQGIEPIFRLITNGVFGEEIADFLIRNFFNVIISIDGPATIHNRQRPRRDVHLSPSYQQVVDNLNVLKNAGLPVRARATVGRDGVRTMLNIVKHFHEIGFDGATLEPIKMTGLAAQNEDNRIDYVEFAEGLSQCLEYGHANGFKVSCFHELRYPSLIDRVRHKITSFCGSNGDYLIVSHDGKIRSCFECVRMPYIYGDIGPEGVRIDGDRHDALMARATDVSGKCDSCFAKYSCGGGCSYNAVMRHGSYYEVDRSFCKANRIIVAKALAILYEAESRNANRNLFRLYADD